MNIKNVSKELYAKLRIYEEVVGIGISCVNNEEYIIVYLSKSSSGILKKIPSDYKGIIIKTEITGRIYLQ